MSATATEYTRCGGDGPNPLSDLGTPVPRIETLPTKGRPAEMILRERAGELIYRNQAGEVWSHRLSDARSRAITHAPAPLSVFADPEERFLIAGAGRWIFDTLRAPRWADLQTSAREPVFSNAGTVYTIARGANGWSLASVSGGESRPLCPGLSLPASFRPAVGHRYPFVYFQEPRWRSGSTQLSVHRVHVDECWLGETRFLNPIEGKVRQVFVVADKGLAVKVDHPTKNLLWSTQSAGCRYFDIGNAMPVLPNVEQPYLVTRPPAGGLSLIELETERKAEVAKSSAVAAPLGEHDVILSADGKSLFVRGIGIQRIHLR